MPPGAELRHLVRPDTIIGRCEGVPAGLIAARSSWGDAKLQTRCGMDPCQGRIRGGATTFLYGWPRGTIRPPTFPVSVQNLAAAASMLAPPPLAPTTSA